MQRIVLLLLGMASLVASGVIMDRGRVGFNAMGGSGLGLQTVQGVRGGIGGGNVLTRDELLKQKFILDILQQIYVPLQQQDLLALGDRNIVTNEDLYMRPLTQEMYEVLDLIRNNQILGKHSICNVQNEQHVRQMVGLYRLFVNARDFDTFKRLVVYARQNVNNEMFVYSLILALGERQDTQMLIVPALYEILPQLFIKDRVIDQVQQLDTGVSSVRPQLLDIIGMGRGNPFVNSRFAGQQEGGLWGALNKSQFWMPWRELHKQIALRKVVDGNVVQQDNTQVDKVVISLPGNGLLSQDIGLKAYVSLLIDEILLHQDSIRNSNTNYQGIGQSYGDVRKNRYENDWYTNSLYGRQYSTAQEDSNTDRFARVGGRFQNTAYGVNDELEQNIYGNLNSRADRYANVNDDSNLYYGARNIQNRFGLDQEMGMGSEYQGEGQTGANTVSVNDPRLLFVGRRRKNPNNVVNMDNTRYGMGNSRYPMNNNQYQNQYQYDDDEYISGGRQVSYDSYSDERQKGKYNQKQNKNYEDDSTYENKDRYAKFDKHGKAMRSDNNEQDYAYLNKNRGYDSNNAYQTYQDNDYAYRNTYGRGAGQQGMGAGRNSADFLSMIRRSRIGQSQYYDNDQYVPYTTYGGYFGQNAGESLDKHLPTTDINDERLLYVNRHRLDNAAEGRRASNIAGDFDQNEYGVNNQYNTEYPGYKRFNAYQQRAYSGEQNYLDAIQQGNQYTYEGQRASNYDEKRGQRYRRSIVNQESGQTSTINGKLVLYSLQQLVARLNIERIALGQPLLIDYTQNNMGRGIISNNVLALTHTANVDAQTIARIENIIQHINQALQQQIGQVNIPSYNQQVNEIGLILAGQIQGLGLNNILADVLQQTNQQERKGLIANMLENEAAQILLAGIVQVVDQQLQQVYRQREEFISTVRGITINNVAVDKFQTYVEQTEVDLTNLLNNNNAYQTAQGAKKVVVGQVPRLNHKSFSIEIDVTSDHQQQVVVRNLLVPKVDGQNNIIPLAQRRQNVIVLDVTTAELQPGHNYLKLKSKDITITSRDTTPFAKIYQQVMQALSGERMWQQDLVAGQSTLLPHRLLLPRGRATGLPMQLITVITPLTGSSGIAGFQNGAELNTLFLDNLPLNYPLHCDITNYENVVSMPNLMVKDVQIYHEDKMSVY